MQTFHPKKHIWSGIYCSFSKCKKSKDNKNFFEEKPWLNGQNNLLKTIVNKKSKSSLLTNFLKSNSNNGNFSLFDLGGGCALEYFNIIKCLKG